jgi:hypothetical protein
MQLPATWLTLARAPARHAGHDAAVWRSSAAGGTLSRECFPACGASSAPLSALQATDRWRVSGAAGSRSPGPRRRRAPCRLAASPHAFTSRHRPPTDNRGPSRAHAAGGQRSPVPGTGAHEQEISYEKHIVNIHLEVHAGRRQLDNAGKILLDALGFEAASTDSLAASAGPGPAELAARGLKLELEGWVARPAGGRCSRRQH